MLFFLKNFHLFLGNGDTKLAQYGTIHAWNSQKDTKLRIASSCHGSDGMGNQGLPPATATKPVDQPAAAFLVEQANLYPGQVTVVALGPLTNLALVRFSLLPPHHSNASVRSISPSDILAISQALELDPSFPKKVGQVVVLGGAYSVNGNVNPAAETNVSS